MPSGRRRVAFGHCPHIGYNWLWRHAQMESKDEMPTLGDTLELDLTDMTHGGEALGRHQGLVCFVPHALPGERVRVKVTEARSRYLRGELIEVMTASPHRTTPPCQHFGICGGCHWQHIAYPAQLVYKQRIVQEQITRLAKLPDVPVRPVLSMDEPWHYRNHVQFRLDREGNIGYLAARSHEVVAIEECYLPHPLIEEVLASLELDYPGLRQVSVRVGTRTEDAMVILETADDAPEIEVVDLPLSIVLLPPDGAPQTLVGDDHITEELAGRRYRISAGSFFQVNTAQAEHLVRLVREALAPTGDELLLDLYCGVGTFGLALADQVRQVIGIEEGESAILDASENAEGLENVELWQGSVEEALSEVDQRADLVVLDPPRAGMEAGALAALIKLAPQRIAYVSCDPASLARDLRILADGGYEVQHVQPVDMFPQTYHVETVCALERKESPR